MLNDDVRPTYFMIPTFLKDTSVIKNTVGGPIYRDMYKTTPELRITLYKGQTNGVQLRGVPVYLLDTD